MAYLAALISLSGIPTHLYCPLAALVRGCGLEHRLLAGDPLADNVRQELDFGLG